MIGAEYFNLHCIIGNLGIENSLRVESAIVVTDASMIAPDNKMRSPHVLAEISV